MRRMPLFALTLALLAPVATAVAQQPQARDIRSACPPDEVPESGFEDIRDSVHRDAIECMAWYEIAEGVSDTAYAPGKLVRRDQMASFVARLIDTVDPAALPSDATEHGFSDVSDRNVHRTAIARLSLAGLVRGTGGGRYEPGGVVGRDQMATFLNRTHEFLTGVRLRSPVDWFDDDNGNVHEPDINAMAAAGIVAGRGQGQYEPHEPVRRDAMASYLARTLDLFVETLFAVAKSA